MDAERLALDAALERIGDRWSLLIAHALSRGALRYSQLQETLDGISPTVLSQRLKRLEAAGVVLARPYSRRPLRLAYELTPGGAELVGALRLLAAWGARGGDVVAPAHEACGTPLDARWWCPTCARVVDEEADEDLRRL